MAREFGNVAFPHPLSTKRSALRCRSRYLLVFCGFLPISALSSTARRATSHNAGQNAIELQTGTRICSDRELANYALLIAVGPARAPECVPGSGQSLKAQLASDDAVLGGAAGLQVREDEPAKGGFHFVHLHVVQSTHNWCKHPCNTPTWELAAPKPGKGSPYLLFEAAIWRQTRKITLYKFDDAWEKKARNSYAELCGGKSWGCANYTKFREAQAVVSVGPWPEGMEADHVAMSAFVKDAFQKVFAEVQKAAGEKNSALGLTYSGHGGSADGSLFAGVLSSPDATSLLRGLVDAGGKFAMFNFGTNCQEGKWGMLAALHPFADWILASDHNVGGLEEDGGEPTMDVEVMRAQEQLAGVAVIKRAMEARQSVKKAVASIVQARRKLWTGAMKADIKKQKLRQSIAAFVASKFPDLATSLKSAFQKLPAGRQEDILEEAENTECDVLAAVRSIDSASASFVQAGVALRGHSGPLEAQFRAFRPEYASSRSLFDWEPVTHGLRFNTLGASGWCDLESALGHPSSHKTSSEKSSGSRSDLLK